MEEPWSAPALVRLAVNLLDSHRRWTGRELGERLGNPVAQAQRLYEAPEVVLAHDGAADPRFTYANRAAQDLWGYGWDDFIGMPSRLSAEPAERAERARLLERTARDGFVDDYQGVRVTRNGRRFRIERATVWNLVDGDGQRCGQAASFAKWTWL